MDLGKTPSVEKFSGSETDVESVSSDQTHRTLRGRHVQLIGIGGTIGTVLFVQIGSNLPIGGPASLVIAFLLWSTVVLAVNNCLSEMVTWIPISSPYVRFADRFVDEALGVCSGVNLVLTMGLGIPYETVAFNLMLNFWTDKIPVAAVVVFIIVLYAVLNLFAVRFYGESEFWLSIGKVILIVGLLIFTFVVMVGGNPQHDAFGFRNWDSSKVPGTPFVAYQYDGDLGRFLGFLSCLVQASFTVIGPEYVAMTAGEAAHPRRTLPRSFQSFMIRCLLFFILGAISVGVLVPYNDPSLLGTTAVRPGTGTSPYVIAMVRMRLGGLAHVVNALVMLSILSAGNSFVYITSRTLYGLALEGRMPRVFARCNKQGVPVNAVCFALLFSILAFLQLSHPSAIVLLWITRFATVGGMANYAMIAFSYLRYRAALKAQGIPKDCHPPQQGFWQPFCGYYALIACFSMIFISGYSVFLPGHWNTLTFIFSYALVPVLPIIFVVWKVARRTKWRSARDIDLFTAERAEIDAYESALKDTPARASFIQAVRSFLGRS
ncbi:general amino acid permease AGP2 [Roridomyces roridus]|uniref:General amino acid permease AGP2 n=1 Tax=Roridomyces roridus TaxID=1738132 RepID=A0AAD7BQ17_9AGAR|nr:general amino acid permease AGP2 [Roridomyces roridus]